MGGRGSSSRISSERLKNPKTKSDYIQKLNLFAKTDADDRTQGKWKYTVKTKDWETIDKNMKRHSRTYFVIEETRDTGKRYKKFDLNDSWAAKRTKVKY